MSKRVLFTATLVRGHIAKFHIPYLKWFKQQGWETWVASHNDYPDGDCSIPYCDNYLDIDFARSPFSKRTVIAYRQLRNLFKNEHFDIVHTHTPVAGVLTRIAARDARKKGTKIIYTAHGFHFYNGAPIANWILWYPIERIMTRWTDVLITINREDYKRAQRFAHCDVRYVPGVGIDIERFSNIERRDAKREELGLERNQFAILSVGDLIPRKNQLEIIKALTLLPTSVHLIICGEGPEKNRLEQEAQRLGVRNRVLMAGFRNDIPSIMNACDCLVFPSIHEGLPVSVMEAMASGLPVVASRIRGIEPDLLQDHFSGLLLGKNDAESISKAVGELLKDRALSAELAKNAANRVTEFELDRALLATSEIYSGGVPIVLSRGI